jgi:hypothetical protein
VISYPFVETANVLENKASTGDKNKTKNPFRQEDAYHQRYDYAHTVIMISIFHFGKVGFKATSLQGDSKPNSIS